MRITYDNAKRDKTLTERGLDFARAGEVLEGLNLTQQDTRVNYGEPRFATAGPLGWTVGRGGLDPARHGSPHHQHEESK